MSQLPENRSNQLETLSPTPENRHAGEKSKDLQGSIEHFRLPDILQLNTAFFQLQGSDPTISLRAALCEVTHVLPRAAKAAQGNGNHVCIVTKE